ncbi:MAG: single-stranded-DNA-specific exonuclease RecJ [Clostridia bacterium]|nr:single-stranded-DNA-specific exonuclease RecJ [Clostridia bacterium]
MKHRLICRGVTGALPGFAPWLASLLLARGADTPEKARAFLHPQAGDLNDPFLMQGMETACRVIRETIAAGGRIAVYGDYDCDGVCASVILLEALQTLGADARVYIPSRQDEGYGLNEEAVRRLAADCRLLVSVDCGVTAVRETELAKELGMRVILTDHHTLPEILPPADAVLHPKLGAYPCPDLCGAGVAWKLACALTGERAQGSLELCALATIADMVPLLGENRALAALGLAAMAKTQRPGLRALLSVAGIPAGREIGGTQAAFQLAPRVNACGRMDTAQIAVDLFTSRDPQRALALAEQADALNARRRSIEQRLLEQADAQAREMDLYALRCIVVEGEGWESGVVGLVAGRLAERYGYPTVALSREGDVCVGSARSACGVDLYQALSECADLFTRFGGHKQAAGITLPAGRVEELRQRLSDAVARQLDGRALMPQTAYDAELPLSALTLELIESLKQLEPFGMGNPAPVFLLKNADVLSSRAVGAQGAHLKLTLSQGSALMDAVAFGMGGLAASLSGVCDLAVTPVANAFNGRVTAECRVEALSGTRARFPAAPEQEAAALLDDLSALCRAEAGTPDALCLEFPPPEGEQGTLYLCRTAETAGRVAARFPELDLLPDGAREPRAYSALALGNALAPHGPYRRVVLCDGACCAQEYAALKTLYPQAAILCLPQSEALQARFSLLRFTVDELRACYRALRDGRRPDLSAPRNAAMARVLQSLSLVDETLRVLPSGKVDLTADPLFHAIHGGDA